MEAIVNVICLSSPFAELKKMKKKVNLYTAFQNILQILQNLITKHACYN